MLYVRLCVLRVSVAVAFGVADSKTFALSVRDYQDVTREVIIKHYRIHKLPDGAVFIARRCTFASLLLLVEHYQSKSPE